jgi:hypothetical protein
VDDPACNCDVYGVWFMGEEGRGAFSSVQSTGGRTLLVVRATLEEDQGSDSWRDKLNHVEEKVIPPPFPLHANTL